MSTKPHTPDSTELHCALRAISEMVEDVSENAPKLEAQEIVYLERYLNRFYLDALKAIHESMGKREVMIARAKDIDESVNGLAVSLVNLCDRVKFLMPTAHYGSCFELKDVLKELGSLSGGDHGNN